MLLRTQTSLTWQIRLTNGTVAIRLVQSHSISSHFLLSSSFFLSLSVDVAHLPCACLPVCLPIAYVRIGTSVRVRTMQL